MKPKESHTSSLNYHESVLARFCTAFLEAGWIAAAVLSALFVNIYTNRMFEADKAILIRSIAILMLVPWLIKAIEYRVLAKSSTLSERYQEARPKYWWLKYSVFLLAGLYFLSYLISSLTSVLPVTSFWGSYEWRQGLYTTLAYFVIFILAATYIRTRAQVERLITAIILTSLLVMAYGLIQKLGWDPGPWREALTRRTISTLGNPIFFAAYLIMVVPLTLARLVSLLKYSNPDTSVGIRFKRSKVSFYSLVLLFQIISIILTESRGPFLGLISGVTFFFFIYAILYRKKVLVWSLAGGLILGTIFVIIFNLPNTPLEPLKKVPYLERLGRFNPSEDSARVRIILWGNALKLMRETYQPILPHPELIDAHPWRFILGYGPETLANIFFRYHTAEFTSYEGPTKRGEHCHNCLFQALVTQGVFGLVAFLCLISGAIYLGLRTLKHLTGSTASDGLALMLLGIISAIIAHFVESLFGLGTVAIYTHFWLFLALLHYFSVSPSIYPTCPTVRRASEGHTRGRICTGLFWVYLVISLVIIVVMVKTFSLIDTNIKVWITGTYLWILLGVLLGAITLLRPASGHPQGHLVDVSRSASKHITHVPQRTLVSLVFNIVGYIGLIVVAFSLTLVAFFLIIRFNFNLVLADGYYKSSFWFNNESKVIRKSYGQAEGLRRKLLQKKEKARFSPDEEKQLQLITERRLKMLSDMFGLHLHGIVSAQRALRLAPNEQTYLHGMGENFLRLAVIWRAFKDSGWTVGVIPKDSGVIDMNTLRHLNGPPSIKEIMDFSIDQYSKLNQYDFFYCCLAVMRKAYEIEPTNYNRRLAMAQVYRYGALMTRRDSNPESIIRSDEYFKKAMEYYQKAKEASPDNPLVNEDIKTIQKEMGEKH